MKRTLKALLAGTAFIALTLASCTDPNSMASSTAGIIDNDDDTTLKDNNGKSDKDTLPGTINPPVFSGDFIRGFDASAVDYDEALNSISSSSWKDTDGKTMDFFKVLANNGVNTVRFRLWVDPSKAQVTGDDYWPSIGSSEPQKAGDNTLERYKRMARRAKNAGLKVMLDFHYSDYWTDPGVQVIPADWQDITTADAMADKVKSYTAEVLTSLAEENLLPDFVQVGNEIDSGILLHSSVAVSNSGKTKNPAAADSAVQGKDENLYKYLKAGAEAVRDKAPNAKIILHVTNRTNGINTMSKIIGANVDFDIVGLSFYPWESGHRTTTDLANSITKFKAAHDVMVVETSAHWKARTADDGLADSGSDAYYELKNTKEHMVDFKNLAVDTTNSYVLATLDNSRHVIEDIMQTVKDAGGIGVCTWGGERRADWKYGMFDWDNCQAMSNIKAFSYNFDGTSGDSGAGGGTDDDDEPPVGEVITKLENDTASAKIAIGKEGTYQLVVEYNAIRDYDKVYITLANITSKGTGTWDLKNICLGKAAGTGDDKWVANAARQEAGTIFTDKNVNSSTAGYFASISPSTYKDGVYITGTTGLAGTLYVTGVKVSTEGTTCIKTETGSCTVGGDWKSYAEAISASKFEGLNVTKLEITVTLSSPLSEGNIGVGGSANNEWLADLAWSTPSGSVFTVTLSEEDKISNIKTNGLGLAGDYSGNADVSVKITYIE
ncbi:MAG: glycosyl hydrolase 53 family protein [Treponema sp.]|nr:glycosyl hydrolase 53 family protein [Treponema sp.]